MTLHHTSDETCPLCIEKLKRAHLYLVQWFSVLKRKYPNIHVSRSWSDQAEQDGFYAKGRKQNPDGSWAIVTPREVVTELRWPFSAHNHTDRSGMPQSMALDLFQLDEDGVARWVPLFFAKVNAENEKAGEPLQWGGKFKSLGDSCHFQFNAKNFVG